MAKLSTIKRGDTRYYVNAEGEKVPGVTSIINQLPKPFLAGWAAKVVAEWCADNAGSFLQLLINGERDSALQLAKGAPRRSTSDAANVGSSVHDYFELYARGDAPKRAPLDVQPFVRHIQEFHDKYQPEYLFLEDAVWSYTHDYAGSFDWIARINGEVVLGDTKTTRSGVHAEVALQLNAYANADVLIKSEDGAEVEIPKFDAAAVFHLRPEGWKLVPVRLAPEVFDHFLALRKTFDWTTSLKDQVLGDPDYDSQAATLTGTKRRAS